MARPRSRARAASPPAARGKGTAVAERRRVTQELRALAHPLRLRLLECFAQGRRTTMQVAAELGEPPTRLYHHVNALERAGFLRLRETRPNRGTTEKFYEVTRAQFGADDPSLLTGRSGQAVRGLAAQVLEQSRGELMAALSGPDLGAPHTSAMRRRASPVEAPLAARLVIRVAARDQAKLRRRLVQSLHALGREFKPRTQAEARAWSVTVALAPTLRPEPKNTRKRRAKA